MRPATVRRVFNVLDRTFVRSFVANVASRFPRGDVVVRSHEVANPGVPVGIDGLRIAHATDLHLNDRSPAMALPDVLEDLDFDLLAFTGDFIDQDADVPVLERLLARLPASYPKVAVLGNHDHWSLSRHPTRNDVDLLVRVLGDNGVTVLVNTHTVLAAGALVVAGVDDPVTARPDVAAATRGVPAGAFVLLLAHTPDVVNQLSGCHADLVLTGHTHGGQVRLPAIGPVVNMSRLPRNRILGFFDHDGIPVYVNAGMGYSGVDVRFRCPSEVAVFTLRRSAAAGAAGEAVLDHLGHR